MNKIERLESMNKIERLESMNKIERIVRGLGWLDKLQEKAPITDKGFIPNENQPGSKWAALVQSAKKTILALKAKDIPSSQNPGNASNEHVDEVVVSDISYIDKNFQAKQDASQKFINDTAKDFCLNNHAFCIVANHATLHKAEQLRMFLGGMGG